MRYRIGALAIAVALVCWAPPTAAQGRLRSALRATGRVLHRAVSYPIPLGSRIKFNIAPRVRVGQKQIVFGLLPRVHTPRSKAFGLIAITTKDRSSSFGVIGLSSNGTGNGLIGMGGKDGNGAILGYGYNGTGRGLIGIGGTNGYGVIAYGDRGRSMGLISIPGM